MEQNNQQIVEAACKNAAALLMNAMTAAGVKNRVAIIAEDKNTGTEYQLSFTRIGYEQSSPSPVEVDSLKEVPADIQKASAYCTDNNCSLSDLADAHYRMNNERLLDKEASNIIRSAAKQIASAGETMRWVKASERLPDVENKASKPRYAKVERVRSDGSVWCQKVVAYYFPDRFKTVEWEDWDDYKPEDYPYTELDNEKSVVWLKEGWYGDIDCRTCEPHWSAPLDVIEWLDESASPSDTREEAIKFAEWIHNEVNVLKKGWSYKLNFCTTQQLYDLYTQSLNK